MGNKWKSLYILFSRYLRQHTLRLIFIGLFSAGVGSLLALRPLLVAPLFETILNENTSAARAFSELSLNNLGPTLVKIIGIDSGNTLAVFAMVAAAYFLLSLIIAAGNAWTFCIMVSVRINVLKQIMKQLHHHMIDLSVRFFNKNRTGDLISYFSTDAVETSKSLEPLVRGMVQSLIQILFILLVLLKTDVLLTLYTLALGSCHLIITRFLSDYLRRSVQAAHQRIGIFLANIQESLSLNRLFKYFSVKSFEQKRIDNSVEDMGREVKRYRIASFIESPIRIAMDGALVGIVILLAYYARENGRMTDAAMAMYFYLALQLIIPISDLSRQALFVSGVEGSASRLLQVFQMSSEVDEGKNIAPSLKAVVEFKNLSFSYDGETRVLKDINLTIHKGESIAIVGPSGAGKSSLIDLLLRLYDPTEGAILFDGENVRNFTQSSYRSHFGVVPQESMLLNASVKENILLGRAGDTQHLKSALRIAHADEFIQALPQQVDTFVGDRGVRLSGGQRQRISMARAVYGQPDILVLDEATSSLDTKSERMVQAAITEVIQHCTAIVIAHRMSTIAHCDRIVVINEGQIEAVGTHEELHANCPLYKRLYNLQFLDSLQN